QPRLARSASDLVEELCVANPDRRRFPVVEEAVLQLGHRQMLEEICAVDELHREEPVLFHDQQFVEARQIGMPNFCKEAELALEASESVGRRVLEELDGHRAISLAVERLVHHAERAGTDLAPNVETIAAVKLHSLKTCRAHQSESWYASRICLR